MATMTSKTLVVFYEIEQGACIRHACQWHSGCHAAGECKGRCAGKVGAPIPAASPGPTQKPRSSGWRREAKSW